ncbi:MAG: acetylesterase [Firmicutes bacterium]|nr:acetylesterase [Bacillota bacterium]
MAVLQVKLSSASLLRSVPVTVILPVDKVALPGMPYQDPRPFKTLYLLHGMFGDQEDWIQYTNIRRYAEEHDLCVVCPYGENRFYTDQPKEFARYGQFIGEELVELTRRMFPLSTKREDTWIGGLSMGGYGALRNGLKYHETFGRICSLSTANLAADLEMLQEEAPFPLMDKRFVESLMGGLDTIPQSDNSIEWLAADLAGKKVDLPSVYLACGLSDPFLEGVRKLKDLLLQLGYRVIYDERPGGHEWDFWDAEIKEFLG